MAALKVLIATGLFGAIHSALASRQVKRSVENAIGTESFNAFYRLFFNAQSVITFGALVALITTQKRRTIYRVRGAPAVLLRAGQLAGIVHAVIAAREVGITRLIGISDLPPTVAQGPERGEDGKLTTGGPFRWTRHPLNLSPLPVFWLTPHMTTRRLAFNIAATAYLVLGSLHEEIRLQAEYGKDYERYRRSGAAFYLPGVGAIKLPRSQSARPLPM